MQDFFVQYLMPALVLIGLAIALTVLVFRRRMFDRTGVYREGVAAHPEKVRQQNRRQASQRDR
jgi:hypothetical protein